MQKTNLILEYMIIGILSVSLLGGCSLFATPDKPKTVTDLMEHGEKLFDQGRYAESGEVFQTVKDRYPYSGYAAIAEVRLADGHYEKQEFEDAYMAYDDFERLHPKNERIPYVMYRKGMCEFEQITAMDREQSHALKARREFLRLIRRFPENVYADKAKKHLRKTLLNLTEYELSVGHFYFKMGEYEAALNRYTHLIKNYPDTGYYHEALEYIRKCHARIEQEKTSEKEKFSLLKRLWPL
ncbi:MAG: outer membrane protein assembly factor BamD [Deltaproteobacteria bacterium]|nr:outer membrane protein assembly factor BamD [Deltaproteobacteria bacterium]